MKHPFMRHIAALALFLMGGAGATPAQETVAPSQTRSRGIDSKQAFMLMAAEAENGSPEAMLTLGVLYERGAGTARNYGKALEWYGKAAEAGLAEGYYNLGVCHEIGMGTAVDPLRAFENFERSAELELAQGLYKLASLYITGFGVDKNEAWGVTLLARAAANHAGAMNDLGAIFSEGLYGQPRDDVQALEWFGKAAELGNAEAMKNLAVFHHGGDRRPADPKQELKWYALARLAGYPAAALTPAIDALRAEIGDETAKEAEREALAWLQTFRQRARARQTP